MTPTRIPDTVFHTRVRDETVSGPNPFKWQDVTSSEIFSGRNIVLFAVPGAFTPTCSDDHLPGYEAAYDEFLAQGIDDVICLSVNDAFVMYQWAQSRNVTRVRMLPDGNGDFTRGMGMMVARKNTGMGDRSWRYAMHVENGEIRKLFSAEGFRDEPAGVPLDVTDAQTMLDYLQARP